MEKFFIIVLMVIGAILLSYYAGQAVTNYGDTKKQKVQRVIQYTLMITGAVMFVGGVLTFPIFFI